MNKEDLLYNKYGKDPHMTVPDDYFENVYKEISSKLPEYPQERTAGDLTTWQKLRPYVYLAAMFAGIWCMMQMFHIASGNITKLSLDNPPAQIAMAMQDNSLSEEFGFLDVDSSAEIELVNDIVSTYENINDFERDFGYVIDSKYDDMELSD